MYEYQLKTLASIQLELVHQRSVPPIVRNGRRTQAIEQEPTPSAPQNVSPRRSSIVDPPHSADDSTIIEDDVEEIQGTSELSQGVLSIKPQSRQQMEAGDGPSQFQATDSLLRQEPTMSLEVTHRPKSQCRRPCSCQCHRSSRFKTPDFLRHVTGQFLVGYTGISSLTPPCNEHACAQRQTAAVRVQYQFPVWSLIQRMLTVLSSSGGAYGPEKILRMSRIRPGLDEVFIQVQSGNLHRLQQLFVQGSASPFDASDTGWTLLHYALTAGQLPTAKFLKDAGADLHAESASRQTPSGVAWNRILSGSLDETSENLLREVFNNDSQLDERQFTTLHKVVLGMIGKNLADELELTTAFIDAIDSSGNTPLAWASARGDHLSVALLLEYGASMTIANDVDHKPIHLAAQTGNVDTIRILVHRGADINTVVSKTKMTPIHFAAEFQDSCEQIKGLASLGARIDGKDYLEWTPLHWASWRGHLASLNTLISCGADVNAKTLDGNASIMLAVANNSHECVRRLIELGADCSVVRDSQWSILHYAAIGASVDTLRALEKADLSATHLQGLRTRDTDQTAADMLGTRLKALEDSPFKQEEWKLAWDKLMVNSEPHGVGQLSRSNTDSSYHDADDTLFDDREEG